MGGLIIAGILFLGGAAALSGVVLYVRKRIRDVSSQAFGTPDFIQGMKAQEEEFRNTPKSLSGMTRIYEPLIAQDFPDFNLPQFIVKAENMLLSVFNAIEAQNTKLIVNASPELTKHVESYIEDQKSKDEREFYNDTRIHDTVLMRYQKSNGRCVISLQSAVEFKNYLEDASGNIIRGDRTHLEQARCNTEIIYIQDPEKVAKYTGESVIGINCPNCGAPIRNLGQKYCEYCGTGVIDIHIKTWEIHRYDLIRSSAN
ncbi:MAG: zinc ribbon domain-containing protein [Lachnospiraceae bacterium]|jgi:predicted lipid-binding transport protein (Tim44 family)|nr:zinc ribbon domain-containing protein [Lachnospiraceae bacterium]